MVDFLKQTNNSQSPKPNNKIGKQTIVKNSSQKNSWLRGLFHPVNGDKSIEGSSIDLLAVAKKQTKGAVSGEQVKQPIFVAPKTLPVKIIPPLEVKKDIKQNKKLSKEGSDKVRQGFDVNLLPATFRFQSTNKLVSFLILWAILAFVVLGVLYVGISFYGQSVTEEALELEVTIEILDSEIIKYSGDVAEASKWQIKLAAVDSLLRSHVYWTNFFTILETTTLPSVYYNGFTASLINSDINLVSYANSFSTVAKQLMAYERFPNVFSNFSVAEASLDEGKGINYNALVSLKRSLFYDDKLIEIEEK